MAELFAQASSKPLVLHRGDEVEGKVLSISETDIILDLGGKAEGVIERKEFPEVKAGDSIKAYVLFPENESGQVVLSTAPEIDTRNINPRQLKRYQRVLTALQQKNRIQAKIVDLNKGGLVLEIDGLRGFLPASQIGISTIALFEGELTDKILSVTVLEVEPSENKLIFASTTNLTEEIRKDLDSFKTGEKVESKVIGVYPFGLVVEIVSKPVLRSLILSQEVSWDRVENLNTLFKIGQEIETVVVGIDVGIGKLNLSLKRTLEDPFTSIADNFQPDDVVTGVVKEITQNGILIQLEGNIPVEGFVPTEKVEVGKLNLGQKTNFLVDSVDKSRRRIILAPFITSTVGLIYK